MKLPIKRIILENEIILEFTARKQYGTILKNMNQVRKENAGIPPQNNGKLQEINFKRTITSTSKDLMDSQRKQLNAQARISAEQRRNQKLAQAQDGN